MAWPPRTLPHTSHSPDPGRQEGEGLLMHHALATLFPGQGREQSAGLPSPLCLVLSPSCGPSDSLTPTWFAHGWPAFPTLPANKRSLDASLRLLFSLRYRTSQVAQW